MWLPELSSIRLAHAISLSLYYHFYISLYLFLRFSCSFLLSVRCFTANHQYIYTHFLLLAYTRWRGAKQNNQSRTSARISCLLALPLTHTPETMSSTSLPSADLADGDQTKALPNAMLVAILSHLHGDRDLAVASQGPLALAE